MLASSLIFIISLVAGPALGLPAAQCDSATPCVVGCCSQYGKLPIFDYVDLVVRCFEGQIELEILTHILAGYCGFAPEFCGDG